MINKTILQDEKYNLVLSKIKVIKLIVRHKINYNKKYSQKK